MIKFLYYLRGRVWIVRVTVFGKFCRKLRVDNEIIMRDMAMELKVSTAFLSSVETGKKEVPGNWAEKLIDAYNLKEDESQCLFDAIEKSKNEIKIKLSESNEQDRDLAIMFVRKFTSLNEERKKEIYDLLK